MLEYISSVNNARVKDTHNLKQKKFRLRQGLFVIEGLRAVEEAVMCGQVKEIFYLLEDEDIEKRLKKFRFSDDERTQNVLETAYALGIYVYATDKKVMEKISDTGTPQGILAVVKMSETALADLPMPEAKNSPVVVLDRVQDPGNMGTIIRSADAAGARCVVLLKGCADIYNPKVVRSTMGSMFHLPVISNVEPEELISWCGKEGYQLAVTTLDEADELYDADLNKKTAFVLGNEANGVGEELLKAADIRLFIPMQGKAESMNVAMATTVILYESLRQRRKK